MQESPQDILELAAQSAERIRTHLEQDQVGEALSILTELREADQANALSHLDLSLQRLLFSLLTHEAAGTILNHIDIDEAVDLVKDVDPIALGLWLDNANTNVAAQILRQLPPEKAGHTLEEMSEVDAVLPLLEHADETAGGIMTPEFVAFKERTSAAEALSLLRRSHPDPRTMNYLFVVDMWNRLTGLVALSDLVLADPDAQLSRLMDPKVIFVAAGTDQEECARIMRRYDISSLPVVDHHGRLLGAILVEDVLEVAEEEATEDMYHMVGLSESERVFSPLGASVRNRLPWLVLNLATVGLGVAVISAFESTIATLVAIAAFLPVVASQGGVGGTQTLTLMVRGLALGEIDFNSIKKALAKELVLGLVNGLILGMVVGLVAFAWKGNVALGLALGLAMVGNMVMAGLSGVVIPLGLKMLRVDPALASVVFVTTVTDIFGFLLFLGLVALLLPVLS
ncbi:MAG: magnesium transporter [Dehalococcoidia bacterium]